jgi:hypothetical protein
MSGLIPGHFDLLWKPATVLPRSIDSGFGAGTWQGTKHHRVSAR